MNPTLTQALAEQRIIDMQSSAAAHRLAAAARAAHGTKAAGAPGRRASRLIRSLGRRRYRQIELIWPDGVCSVVPAQSDDATRPLANSQR
jgi:hypothetical protein